jgi:hypothetical protein
MPKQVKVRPAPSGMGAQYTRCIDLYASLMAAPAASALVISPVRRALPTPLITNYDSVLIDGSEAFECTKIPLRHGAIMLLGLFSFAIM